MDNFFATAVSAILAVAVSACSDTLLRARPAGWLVSTTRQCAMVVLSVLPYTPKPYLAIIVTSIVPIIAKLMLNN